MDEKDKEAMRQRHLRAAERLVGFEEEKQRRRESQQRRSAKAGRRPRRRDWSAEDESWERHDLQRRSKMRQARSPGKQNHAVADSRQFIGLVTAIVSGRVRLIHDDREIEARLSADLAVAQQSKIAVGDQVQFTVVGEQARVQTVLPRRTILSRPDPVSKGRERVLAANIDLVAIVSSARSPTPRPGLIDRFLIALGRGGAEPLICINKIDLLETSQHRQELRSILAPYRDLGIAIVLCSAECGSGIDALRSALRGRCCVFTGHSGVGKSSLANALDPEGMRITHGVRDFDGKGRHTTTASCLRRLKDGTCIVDTPGLRSFGLWQMEPCELGQHFPEFSAEARNCRFANCSHRKEPECSVRTAVMHGRLDAARYASYLRILASLKDP